MTDLIITNIGRVISGDINEPVLDVQTVFIHDGVIAALDDDPGGTAVREIDAGGATLIPGLFDSHIHPVLGDFTPRQRTLDFIESYLHGGVTSMISAGEPHVPGRPKDREGTKALAILAAKAFANARPSGVKVHAGGLLLEPGLVEADFKELAAAGVAIVGEIGISGVNDPQEAAQMARWAQSNGMKVMVHTGGASIPGSSAIGADFVLAVRPDVAAHVNGGPTAPPVEDVERILSGTDAALEVVQCGNVRALKDVVEMVAANQALDRLVIGTDSPSGTGVIPLGILRTISWVSALAGIDPEVSVAMASGNTARVYGFPEGRVAVGAPADLLIVDAPRGSEAEDASRALALGDTLAVAVALIDGEVRVFGSRNTPPPTRSVSIPWMAAGGH